MPKTKSKFGIQIEPQLGFVYETIEQIAIGAEKNGYDSIWTSDHFFLDDKSEERNCLEAWSLLSALAAVTKKIRLGTLVTCNSYRHPAVLAKMAATVDMISNGRLFFGFGAGWKEMEYKAYGIPFPSTAERLYQMEEAIVLIKRLWTEPRVTFTGKYYELDNAVSAPKPVQKPHPPILIGGMGERILLRMVAKYADYCNFFLRPDLERSLEILKAHCKVAGRNYDDIGKSLFAVGIPIYVSDSEDEVESYLKEIANKHQRPLEQVKERIKQGAPGSWVGTPDDLIERFRYFDSLGFEYYQIMFPGFDESIIEASKIFAEKVVAKL